MRCLSKVRFTFFCSGIWIRWRFGFTCAFFAGGTFKLNKAKSMQFDLRVSDQVKGNYSLYKLVKRLTMFILSAKNRWPYLIFSSLFCNFCCILALI